jgi:hypothetical protein
MAIDPARDVILVTVNGFNALYAIDPGAPDREITQVSSAGNQPVISEYAALEYAPNLDRFVYYSANDGPQIYSIAAPSDPHGSQLTSGAWIWRSLLDQGNRLDPVAHAQGISSFGVNKSHTFGRFRVATYGRTDVAILVRHTDTPVYAIRLD